MLIRCTVNQSKLEYKSRLYLHKTPGFCWYLIRNTDLHVVSLKSSKRISLKEHYDQFYLTRYITIVYYC